MRRVVAIAALLAGVACTPDTDEDGLTNKEEQELGTDPENPDTDGDGLGDFAEVRELSTNPLEVDSDCDGFDDPEELDEGSDPLMPLSYPRLKRRWPDLQCHAPTTDLGFRPRQVVENVEMTDQFGKQVMFHQFYGHVVLLDMSAGWCPSCRTWGEQAQPLYEEFRDDGFVIIHSMTDDYSQDRELTDDYFLASWADTYGLTFPVVNSHDTFAYGFYDAGYNPNMVLPFLALLDRNFKVHDAYTGYSDEVYEQIRQDIRKLVKEPPPWER